MKAAKIITLIGAVALLSACGSSSEQNLRIPNGTPNPWQPTNPQWPQNPYTPTPPGGGNPPTQPPNTDTDPTFRSSFPVRTFSVTGDGGNQEVYSWGALQTDSRLRVRVYAKQAGNLSLPEGYSNFQASYYCASFVILVNGSQVETVTLSHNGVGSALCPYAPNNEVIDLSGYLTPGSDQPIDIQVTSPKYDYYCAWQHSAAQSFYTYYGAYWQYAWNSTYGDWNQWYQTNCSGLRDAYRNHTVRGSLEVEINQQ